MISLQGWYDNFVYRLPSGEIIAVYDDITDRKRVEEELREREEKYRNLFNNAQVGIFRSRLDGSELIEINRKFLDIVGMTIEETLGKPSVNLWADPKDREEMVKRLIADGSVSAFEYKMLNKRQGEVRNCLTSLRLYREQGILEGSILDITERMQAEDELRQIEWMLSKVHSSPDSGDHIDSADDQGYGDLTALNHGGLIAGAVDKGVLHGIASDYLDLVETSSTIYEKNGDYALGIFSSQWCRLMDRVSRNLCHTGDNSAALKSGKWLCHESCWTCCSKLAIDTRAPVDIECSGGIRLYAVPIFVGEEVIGAINFGYGDPPKSPAKLRELAASYGLDCEKLIQEANRYNSRPSYIVEMAKRRLQVSAKLIGMLVERKQADEKIKASLQEKEVLLREIHHRVKNNMQVISSLLFLKSSQVDNEQGRQALIESQQRITAMAMIHETLYGSQNLASIDFSDYLKRLVDYLQGAYSNRTDILIDLELEHVAIDINQSVPCSLILNELITNAFKHAFPDGRKGTVRIKLYLTQAREMVLEVSDNGVGLASDMDLSNPSTLGLRLVQGLLKKQLKGSMDVNAGGGTAFTLRWPLPD